jgi:hypothetical protein
MVYVVGSEPEAQLDREDLRAYQLQLKHMIAGAYPDKNEKVEKTWAKLQSRARAGVDAEGHPVLRMQVGNDIVDIGISAENVMNSNAPPQLLRQLLEARLQSELHRSPHGLSEIEVARDWKLLQKAAGASESRVSARMVPHSETLRGNSP